MKILSFFSLLLLLSMPTLLAQDTFSMCIDLDTTVNDSNFAMSIIADESGFLLAALDLCHNNTCTDFIKTDLHGNVQWVRYPEIDLGGKIAMGTLIAKNTGGYAFLLGRTNMQAATGEIKAVFSDSELNNLNLTSVETDNGNAPVRSFKQLNDSTYTTISKGAERDTAYIHNVYTSGEVTRHFLIDAMKYANLVFDTCQNGYIIGAATSLSDGGICLPDERAIIRRTAMDGTPIWTTIFNATTSDNAFLNVVSMPNGNVAVGWATPDTVINGDENAYPYRKYVACLDGETGDLLWRVFFEEEWQKEIVGLRIARNGDIIGVGSDIGEGSGWLFRISPQGELLWEHTYDHLTNPSSYFWGGCQLYDVAETPNGGLAGTGYIARRNANNQWEIDVWLLKVDATGCLTPGCTETIIDIGVGVEPVVSPNTTSNNSCNLFPNPASDNYVFAYYDLRHKNIPATLKLYDLQGKLVAQTLLQTHKNSQTITIGHLPNGLFIYQFEQNGEIIRSGKLLKQPYR